MNADSKIATVLTELSEESLFQLTQVLNKRVRRVMLKGDDKERRELPALRVLASAAQVAHNTKLRDAQ